MSPEPQPTHRRLEGNPEYDAAMDQLLTRPVRQLRLFDRQLGTAFNSARRHDALRAFLLARRSNRIQIVVHDSANLWRDCPRLITLLRSFAHAIAIHETEPQAKGVYDPFALADDRHYLRRFHYEDSRGLLALDDPQGAQGLIQRFDEIWEASSPSTSATTLGL
jgi:hypothetical protein